ncbi:hypothetical protein [Mitsuaria sp. GD03876]|uniref:hypothetical protein n=1 Tax=Mitsuaria sp. GD03876 TaxID=2975399 RepID=UPI00244BD15E|nr:hypothetical protein [Mitsuaria sp. GD03876]MDH0867047.1 hypothetical protein [Mitsuaria sp. GD03876]
MADSKSPLRDRLRPWLIALVWLSCAGLFKAAFAEPSPADTPHAAPALILVTPFGPKSGPGHVARTMADVWAERTGAAVEIRHLPDRQGYAAARLVAASPPDGRVLLLTVSTLLDRPPRLADDPFAPVAATASDFTPLARVGHLPFVTAFPPGMFGRWVTLPAPPAPAPAAVAALTPVASRAAAMVPRSLAPLDAVPDHEDFRDLVARDVPAWNALLAPPRLPAPLAAELRETWRHVLADARVRLALAQTGTELWEILPEHTR